MISNTLVLYCFLAAGIYLLVISLLLEYTGKLLKITKDVPPMILEESGVGWFTMYFIMEFLFYVVIPTLGYSFLYVILPFEGIKAAMAAVLFALTLGAVPVVMGLSVRFKLPMVYLLFFLLSYFIKIGGSLIIIGYLYNL